MANEPTAQMVNETILNYIASNDPGLTKRAQEAVTDYIRIRVREEGFARKIMNPIKITNDELDRQVDTDKPVKIIDMEPESPGAMSMPFGSLPQNKYIRGRRCRVMFDRVLTERYTKDVDELRSYDMDIRQVLMDNAIKDMLSEEDGKFIGAVNSLVGVEGSTITETGAVQNQVIHGGITRETVAEAKKVLPRTNNHLEPTTVLCNTVTMKEIEKWGRDEMGGNLAEDIARNGFSETTFMGLRWIFTIKHELVPENVIYMFADPKFMGKFFVLEDTTMYIDRKAYMLEFFAYETIGATIANVASVARVRFA